MANLLQSSQTQATSAPQYFTDYLSNLASKGTDAAGNAQFVGAQPLQEQAFAMAGQNAGQFQAPVQAGQQMATNAANTDISGAAQPYLNAATSASPLGAMQPYAQNAMQTTGAQVGAPMIGSGAGMSGVSAANPYLQGASASGGLNAAAPFIQAGSQYNAATAAQPYLNQAATSGGLSAANPLSQPGQTLCAPGMSRRPMDGAQHGPSRF